MHVISDYQCNMTCSAQKRQHHSCRVIIKIPRLVLSWLLWVFNTQRHSSAKADFHMVFWVSNASSPLWIDVLLNSLAFFIVFGDCRKVSWLSSVFLKNEPTHEILALFVLCKFIFKKCMPSHTVGLDVCFFVWTFVYFHSSCVRTAKALARLHGCAGYLHWSLMR